MKEKNAYNFALFIVNFIFALISVWVVFLCFGKNQYLGILLIPIISALLYEVLIEMEKTVNQKTNIKGKNKNNIEIKKEKTRKIEKENKNNLEDKIEIIKEKPIKKEKIIKRFDPKKPNEPVTRSRKDSFNLINTDQKSFKNLIDFLKKENAIKPYNGITNEILKSSIVTNENLYEIDYKDKYKIVNEYFVIKTENNDGINIYLENPKFGIFGYFKQDDNKKIFSYLANQKSEIILELEGGRYKYINNNNKLISKSEPYNFKITLKENKGVIIK